MPYTGKIATISQLINAKKYVIGRVLKTSTLNITIFGEPTLGLPVSGRGICSWLVLPSVLSFALPTRCAKGGWEEFSMETAWKIYVLGSKLTLFPYNRGWSSTQFRRALYTHYKDSVIKGGMTIPNIATFDHGTYGCFQKYGKPPKSSIKK